MNEFHTTRETAHDSLLIFSLVLPPNLSEAVQALLFLTAGVFWFFVFLILRVARCGNGRWAVGRGDASQSSVNGNHGTTDWLEKAASLPPASPLIWCIRSWLFICRDLSLFTDRCRCLRRRELPHHVSLSFIITSAKVGTPGTYWFVPKRIWKVKKWFQ